MTWCSKFIPNFERKITASESTEERKNYLIYAVKLMPLYNRFINVFKEFIALNNFNKNCFVSVQINKIYIRDIIECIPTKQVQISNKTSVLIQK